jgi:hypothetical protein
VALSGASAASLPVIGGMIIANTGRLVFQRGDSHLQARFTCLCALLEDAEDDRGPVEDFDAERDLEVSLLAWAQLSVDEHQLGDGLGLWASTLEGRLRHWRTVRQHSGPPCQRGKLSKLPFTHEGGRRPRRSLLDEGAHGLDAKAAREPLELRE